MGSGSAGARSGSRPFSVTRSISSTSRARSEELYEKSLRPCGDVEVACAIEADGVVFHVGSHLGSGLEAGLERGRPGAPRRRSTAARRRPGCCSRTRRARAGRSAARSTSWPALVDALDRTRRSASASTRAISGSRAWTCATEALDATLEELDARWGSTACARCTSTTPSEPLGSNRDRHANVGEGCSARTRGLPRPPRPAGAPGRLETPGKDGHGPDADDVSALKVLHAQALEEAEPRLSRRVSGR